MTREELIKKGAFTPIGNTSSTTTNKTTTTSTSSRDNTNKALSEVGGSVTYKDASGGTGTLTNTGKSYKDNVDYAQAAWDEAAKTYAATGKIDLDAVQDLLDRRQDKIDANGITGVQSNLDIWNAITSKYGATLGSSGGGSSSSGKVSSGSSSGDPYAGTDFHQDAIDAAIRGDWDAVIDSLNKREEKVAAQGGNNRGKTSAQIYSELLALYGQGEEEYDDYFSGSTNSGFNSTQSPQIDSMLDAILNREPFSYDHTTDPTYLAYEQQYKRLGDRAREDTLGDVAALNGGYASSWATTAASQAQNDYNQQLSGVIPELYDAAYNRYLNEDNLMRDDLSILLGIDQTEYDRYRDTVSDNRWEKEFDYMVDRDKVSDSQWEQTFSWNKLVDQWNMDNTEATQKFDQLMSKWQMTGVADNEVAAALGVPVGATTESYYFNKAGLALDQAKLAMDQAKAAQSSKGNGETTDSKLTDSIIRNAKSLVDKTENYSEGAKYILSAVDSADEFYTIGSQAGIPNSILNEVFDSFYDQALKSSDDKKTETRDKTYWKNAASFSEDPEAFLKNNQSQIVADGIDFMGLYLEIMNSGY